MSRRGTMLTILATIYVPVSFATGIFGMNLAEMQSPTMPRWYHVVAIAIPLTVVTVLIPLNFGHIWRNFLRVVLRLQWISRTRVGKLALVGLECTLAASTTIFFAMVIAGPVRTPFVYPTFLTLWIGCAWLHTWAREKNHFLISLLSLAVVAANWAGALINFKWPLASVLIAVALGLWLLPYSRRCF